MLCSETFRGGRDEEQARQRVAPGDNMVRRIGRGSLAGDNESVRSRTQWWEQCPVGLLCQCREVFVSP